MAEPATAHTERNTQGEPDPARSFVAMILSAILPGFGQLYLGQSTKGIIILIVFASALGIFYVNSLPVTEWSDLMRFKPAAKENPTSDSTGDSEMQESYAIHIWTFDDGEKLMYRPSWKLKISASIQGILCWFYAVGDGWRGKRRIRKHA